jgi:VanZ family protein
MMLLSLSTQKLLRLLWVILIAVFPLFFIGGPHYYSTALFHALWDFGHLFFFAGFVIALHKKILLKGWRAGILLSLFVFLVGGAIEIIQAQVGRDGNWQDLLRDLVGAWVGLSWVYGGSRKVWCGRVFAAGLMLPSLSVFVWAAWSQLHLQQQFPLIANFESAIELQAWHGDVERTSALQTSGLYSLKVHLTTGTYTGVSVDGFYNSWQGFTALTFSIYNPEPAPLALTLRVNDLEHELGDNDYNDRFNKKITIEQGWNNISISIAEIEAAPAMRKMNMGSIHSLVLFAKKIAKKQDIYIDNVRLN